MVIYNFQFFVSDDHSRIILKEQSPDYINANLVEVRLTILKIQFC